MKLRLITMAWPIGFSFFVESLMAFTDALVIGRLGTAELASFGITSRVFANVGYVMCFCTVSFVGVFVGEALARGRKEDSLPVLRDALWLCILLGVPLAALLGNIETILTILGQPQEVALQAGLYGKGLMWAVVPYAGFIVLRDYSVALGVKTSITRFLLIAALTNLGLSLLLVHGTGSFDGLGILGAGISTSVVMSGLLLFEARSVLRQHSIRLSFTSQSWSPNWRRIGKYIRLGSATSGTSLTQITLWIGVQLLIGRYGADALAANQIAYSVLAFVFFFPQGVREALAIQISKTTNQGYSAIRKTAVSAAQINLLYLLPLAFLMLFAPDAICLLFVGSLTPETEGVYQISRTFLAAAAVVMLVDGLHVVMLGVLKGFQDTFIPFLLGICGYLLCGGVCAYVLINFYEIGSVGLWAGLLFGLLSSTILFLWRVRQQISLVRR